jgi:hypothetical protein
MRIVLFFAYMIPFLLTVLTIIQGNIPFWYDPARDLILAQNNLQKISLIGQTSGIPGIFYGPYWIWLLSFVQLISKDPRIAVIIILTIPYFVLLPIILVKYNKVFSTTTPLILWVLFVLSFSAYATQIWNPHLAPFFCIVTLLLLATNNYRNVNKGYIYKTLFAGVSAGFLMNFHISFGLSVGLGSIIYLLSRQNKTKTLFIYSAGFLTTYLPFFIFEIRHGFNQIRAVLATIGSTSAVVIDASTIDRAQIISHFFNKASALLQVPSTVGYLITFSGIIYLIYTFKKKQISFSLYETQLLLLLFTTTVAMLGIYLASKNPVWDYHYIGVEVLFLLFLGILISKFFWIRNIIVVWLLVLFTVRIVAFGEELRSDPMKLATLRTKEYIVETIYNDSGRNTFSYYAFNPLHFTPDYDYLFNWKNEQRNSDQLKEEGKGKYIYLIIPWTTNDLKDDFIDNRTPNEEFITTKTWKIADETIILKRERYEKK